MSCSSFASLPNRGQLLEDKIFSFRTFHINFGRGSRKPIKLFSFVKLTEKYGGLSVHHKILLFSYLSQDSMIFHLGGLSCKLESAFLLDVL